MSRKESKKMLKIKRGGGASSRRRVGGIGRIKEKKVELKRECIDRREKNPAERRAGRINRKRRKGSRKRSR